MKNFLHKIGALFTLIFGGAKQFEQFLETHVDEGIAIMSSVRQIVGGTVVTDLISFLPAKYKVIAVAAQAAIEAKLDKVIADITGGKDCLTLPTFADKVNCLASYIKSLSPAMQDAALLKGASMYVQAAVPNAKVSTVDTMVQTRYFGQVNNIPVIGTDDPTDITKAVINPAVPVTAAA